MQLIFKRWELQYLQSCNDVQLHRSESFIELHPTKKQKQKQKQNKNKKQKHNKTKHKHVCTLLSEKLI